MSPCGDQVNESGLYLHPRRQRQPIPPRNDDCGAIGQSRQKKECKYMYVDPTTGGVLFQALAGVLLAVSGIVLVFSRKIREGIAKMRRRGRKDDEE